MKRLFILLTLAAGAFAIGQDPGSAPADPSEPVSPWTRLQATIGTHLGRPYVWGACGLKSYDCSGFVWRVMADNGVMIKRTTARKLFMSLPEVPEDQRYNPGNIVFFNFLTHCGIIASEKAFYHSESSIGTNLSKFDPFWRRKISGFRAMPAAQDPLPAP